MTLHAGPGPTDPVLSVSFDADQIGSRLVWFVDEGRHDLLQRWGPHAGSLHFPHPPYALWVRVKAYGDHRTFLSVDVVDATLIGIPRVYEPYTRTASPFALHSGCTQVPPMQTIESTRLDRVSGRNVTVLQSTEPLRVCEGPGGWMLSMVLTVAIHRNEPARPDETRVFSFDPEAEVGNGSRPGA